MKKYYINSLHYTNSELKAADKFILPYLSQLTHIVLSRRWAEGALKWIQSKLDEFYNTNPRAGKIQTSLNLYDDSPGRYSSLDVGNIFVSMVPVVAEFDFFEVPMFPPEP